VSAPTPLLDFFKRGEVERDVRLMAAQGVLAPRAHEQLQILILLLEDSDREIRSVADETLNRIPEAALKAFLARSDVPISVREFFADRGVFPAVIPAIESDDPLIDVGEEIAEGFGDRPAQAEAIDPLVAEIENFRTPAAAAPVEGTPAPGAATFAGAGGANDDEEDRRLSVNQRLSKMPFTQKLKAAVKGTREMRAILIRDPSKMISASVLSSPKVTEQEVETFARMTNVGEDVLRTIGSNRAWVKNYGVVVGLTKNPKTPLAMSMNFLSRLNDRDLALVSMDRNVPEPLRVAARKKIVASTAKK
jgi:hypothetical protein